MLTIAVRAARSAGRILLRYFERTDKLHIRTKARNDFVSEVDRDAEAAIIREIQSKYPDHAFLGEEFGEQGDSDYIWIIDPLDGTTNYLHGIAQFAVSIALQHRGQLVQAVVYNPASEELFTASRGAGALLNDRRIRVSEKASLEGALLGTGIPFRDQRHMDAYLAMMKELAKDSAGIRRPGSAALDLAYVAAGRYDGFWELGLAPWDCAAGALLIREAGGTVTNLGGAPTFLDKGNILAGNLKIHKEMLERIRGLLPDELR